MAFGKLPSFLQQKTMQSIKPDEGLIKQVSALKRGEKRKKLKVRVEGLAKK